MKITGRKRRHLRIRKKIYGTSERPRLCVYRSNRHISAQIVDDSQGKIICGVSSISDKALSKKKKGEVATTEGEQEDRQVADRRGVDEVTGHGGPRADDRRAEALDHRTRGGHQREQRRRFPQLLDRDAAAEDEVAVVFGDAAQFGPARQEVQRQAGQLVRPLHDEVRAAAD